MAETETKEGRAPSDRPWQAVNPLDAVRVMVDRVLDTVLEPIARMTPPEVRVAIKRFVPCVDVIEEDDEVRVEAEIPGVSPEDISVTLAEHSLVIRGEKKPEKTGGRNYHRSERSYGAFRRVVPIPAEVDRERVDAAFRNGVLTVIIPKSHEAARKVQIRVDEG